MKGLKNKVVVCTGSGRPNGLGAEILRRMAAEGCRLVVTDLGSSQEMLREGHIGTQSEIEAMSEELRASGAEAIAISCDIRKADDVKNLFHHVVEHYGTVDVLVNNAGVGYMMQPFTEVSLESWQLVMDVNLTGTFLCSQEAVRHMIKAGKGGRIINIASQAAKSGFPHVAGYVTSKHGIVGLTRSMACELGEHKITVNAVCPNHVTTGLGEKQNEYFANLQSMSVEDYLHAMRNRIPLRRHCEAADIAAAVAFLASDDAAYITGEAMNVSGGEEVH